MKTFLHLLLLPVIWNCADAQLDARLPVKIKTVTLSDTIVSAAIDRTGDFYAITVSGQIQRLNKDGKLMLLYRADTLPTLFDPRDGARLFAYFREKQQYQYFDPSFSTLTSYQIDPAFAIQPWLICPSGEYKLWILDGADQSLKKVNVRQSEVEVEVVVDTLLIRSATAFKTMREYQNFVFLLNPGKGILIFNSLGRYIRTIEARGIQSFNFLGEELYYLNASGIQFFNLFTAETRALKVPQGYSHALLTDERMILFTPERIDIFPFRP
jgi:hypothetical protein